MSRQFVNQDLVYASNSEQLFPVSTTHESVSVLPLFLAFVELSTS